MGGPRAAGFACYPPDVNQYNNNKSPFRGKMHFLPVRKSGMRILQGLGGYVIRLQYRCLPPSFRTSRRFRYLHACRTSKFFAKHRPTPAPPHSHRYRAGREEAIRTSVAYLLIYGVSYAAAFTK
ncbi:hypothetical protein LZ554_003382 [Drepanopeziza brunnea f. sp. 'monogermtubi']|nr:hypothetical protein LZ554_003382 [Drepanopeziza brunnea f. sp. 'monogermtubi']